MCVLYLSLCFGILAGGTLPPLAAEPAACQPPTSHEYSTMQCIRDKKFRGCFFSCSPHPRPPPVEDDRGRNIRKILWTYRWLIIMWRHNVVLLSQCELTELPNFPVPLPIPMWVEELWPVVENKQSPSSALLIIQQINRVILMVSRFL